MKRYPLETLLRLREHRTESARQALQEKQRQTQACRDACARIHDEIETIARERSHQRARMVDPPPAGIPWPQALEQRERHIEHLAELAVAAQGRLRQAQAALRQAEQAQDEARAAYFRARARQEALEKRRELWRREARGLEHRREEAAAEDLLLGRRPPLIPS